MLARVSKRMRMKLRLYKNGRVEGWKAQAMTMSPLGDRPIKQLSMFRGPFCAQPLPALAFVGGWQGSCRNKDGNPPPLHAHPSVCSLVLIWKSKVQQLELRVVSMLKILRLPDVNTTGGNPPAEMAHVWASNRVNGI